MYKVFVKIASIIHAPSGFRHKSQIVYCNPWSVLMREKVPQTWARGRQPRIPPPVDLSECQ